MAQWDFDPDEFVFLLIALAISAIGVFRWYLPLLRVGHLGRREINRFLLLIAPPIALLPLLFVLTHWADPKYVVGRLDFQFLFLAGGGMWLALVALCLPLLGISTRDDSLERNNLAATLVACATLISAGIIYAGANIGAGPTIWTTIVPALLATAGFLVLAFVVELFTNASEAIAIDHDAATALRHGGSLVAIAIVLARAAAGDWTSWDSTFAALVRLGSPSILFAVGAIALHAVFRPTPQVPKPSVLAAGVVPAAVVVTAALVYISALGMPDIGVHVITFEQYMQGQ